MIDPIVEEIHKIREEYAAKFDYDVDAMFEDLTEKQAAGKRQMVSPVNKEKLIDEDKKAA